MNPGLAVILAGGEGKRIGGSKPLRLIGGERLIDRAVRAARGWADDVRVAVRDPGQIPDPGLPILIDDPRIGGPLAGLQSALQAARGEGADAVLTLPCDLPFLPPDLGSRLRAEIGTNLVAMGSSDGLLHPTCALWRVETLEALPVFLSSGRRSLTGFAERVGFVAVEWPVGAFFNVNDSRDLAEAERRLRSEVQHLDRGTRFDP